jgi:Fe2+ or Zn2+ uptake regulation protein
VAVENIHVQIKNDFPTMSLATVYRNVLLIKSPGEVEAFEGFGTSNRIIRK